MKIKKIIKFIHKYVAIQLSEYYHLKKQYIVYAWKKIFIFMKFLYSNSFTKERFYDKHIRLMLHESMHEFSTKDTYIQ